MLEEALNSDDQMLWLLPFEDVSLPDFLDFTTLSFLGRPFEWCTKSLHRLILPGTRYGLFPTWGTAKMVGSL